MKTTTTKRPPCYECQKKSATLQFAPFCSMRCAAHFGRSVAFEHSYCATCDEWSTWSHEGGNHEHETVDTTEDDGVARWRTTRPVGTEGE